MRVVIVEDQTMIRSLLESYFLAEDGNQIVASIPGAKQAVEVCRASPVDLVLMDVQTEHRENGLVAVRQIKAERPRFWRKQSRRGPTACGIRIPQKTA